MIIGEHLPPPARVRMHPRRVLRSRRPRTIGPGHPRAEIRSFPGRSAWGWRSRCRCPLSIASRRRGATEGRPCDRTRRRGHRRRRSPAAERCRARDRHPAAGLRGHKRERPVRRGGDVEMRGCGDALLGGDRPRDPVSRRTVLGRHIRSRGGHERDLLCLIGHGDARLEHRVRPVALRDGDPFPLQRGRIRLGDPELVLDCRRVALEVDGRSRPAAA